MNTERPDHADHPDDAGTAEADRPARHRSPAVVASVAAAVLVVGGGGAYLAATAAGGTSTDGRAGPGAPSGDRTPPPLALDDFTPGGAGGSGAGGSDSGGAHGIAPGEPNPYGAAYRPAGPLPDGPRSAPVYRPAGTVSRAEVSRLAKALGVPGTPVPQGQTWQVGPGKDGSGPSLRVATQAPGAWTFERYAPGAGAPATGSPVSAADAKKAAAPVLKALGQDTAKLDAGQAMGTQRVVNADPLAGGLPTYGWTTGLTVGEGGQVVGGSGLLKAPVKGDTYPVLSARKTLDLMNAAPRTDHRMGMGGCVNSAPLPQQLERPCGSPTAAPDNTATVEKAVFGLAAHSVGGRQTLVPSWLFDVTTPGARGDFTVTYPAVDPAYLAKPPTPTAGPPRGDEPSSAPRTRDVKVDGYTAGDSELTVNFTGGMCADYTASAAETPKEVRVTVTEKPWPNKICVMIAKEYRRTVHLDHPLGDRKVVGTDGRAIPKAKPARP